MEPRPVIIIPAFRRHDSLERLLYSVNHAQYPENDHLLIISIDGGYSEQVAYIAEKFIFNHGKKEVIFHEKNLGLRNHILWCGNQSLIYENVIILEEDLFTDKFYYYFSISAIDFYKDDNEIAGISLYSPRTNEFANLPFEPLKSQFSVFKCQVPCSWGQIWTKKQWKLFREWYDFLDYTDFSEFDEIPEVVKNWPESSWKKFFSLYLVVKKLFFIYPYISYSTNCSDPGGKHIIGGTNYYQVAMSHPDRDTFDGNNFFESSSLPVAYDSFFEPLPFVLKNLKKLENIDFSVDLYSIKPISLLMKKEFVVTTRCIKDYFLSIPLCFRPLEYNFLHNNIKLCLNNSLIAYCGRSSQLSVHSMNNRNSIRLPEYFCNINLKRYENQIKEKCIDEFYSSISWRLTKPIRLAADIFFKMIDSIKYLVK